MVKSPGSVATIEERGLPFKVMAARMGTRGLRRAGSPGLRAAAGSAGNACRERAGTNRYGEPGRRGAVVSGERRWLAAAAAPRRVQAMDAAVRTY